MRKKLSERKNEWTKVNQDRSYQRGNKYQLTTELRMMMFSHNCTPPPSTDCNGTLIYVKSHALPDGPSGTEEARCQCSAQAEKLPRPSVVPNCANTVRGWRKSCYERFCGIWGSRYCDGGGGVVWGGLGCVGGYGCARGKNSKAW